MLAFLLVTLISKLVPNNFSTKPHLLVFIWPGDAKWSQAEWQYDTLLVSKMVSPNLVTLDMVEWPCLPIICPHCKHGLCPFPHWTQPNARWNILKWILFAHHYSTRRHSIVIASGSYYLLSSVVICKLDQQRFKLPFCLPTRTLNNITLIRNSARSSPIAW